MTESEKMRIAGEAMMAFLGADDPENKAYALGINAGVSPEAKEILKSSVVIDMCSFNLENWNWYIEQSGATALNLTVTPNLADFDGACEALINHFEACQNDPGHFIMADTSDDILRAKKEGKTALILASQNPRFLEHADIDASVEVFARVGMRVIQIGYNNRTFATDGCLTDRDCGLSHGGKQLISAMEKSGILVDLSHISALSAMDAMEYCTKTPVFTHSNPINLFDHPRNITDEAAEKCASMGGVIGVCSYTPILWDGKKHPSIENFVDAIAYYADKVGIDHVGIGIDSNAQPSAYDRHDIRRLSRFTPPNRDVYLEGAEAGMGKRLATAEGLFSIANIVNIIDHMLKRGFKREEIEKVIGLNFLRVFKETWRHG